LQYEPSTTGEQWCQQRPCVDVGDTVLTEPLGTFLVLLLALLWLAVGVYFLRTRRGQRSRAWFGVALVLGGLGAAQAGISYQAFSYELKCEGWDYCRLTNGLEVGYSVAQALSVSAMLVAVAYACTRDGRRQAVIWYAAINAVAYLAVTAAGVLMPSAALLSFTVLMVFAVPGLIIVIALSARHARSDPMHRAILNVALLQVLVQIAYFTYYALGITQFLWDRGIYFSENDVLHVGMLLWLWYVWRALGPLLRDGEGFIHSS